MLSFDSSLSDALDTHSTESFWVLKLYYNAEGSSDFIGVSDQDRIDGSDTYYGLVASWGGLTHSLDFFNFTTSTMNMSLKLVNVNKIIEGGRFSDLFSTYNFANRKWELFQNTGRADTYDTPDRMIGSGIISGDISYDAKGMSIKLLDYTSRYHKQTPKAIIQNTASGDDYYFPNAPEKNVGKPIPMSYGDFYEKDDIGTIPTTYFDRFKQFYKGAFPAIITDKFDVNVAGVEAKIDNQAMHTLDDENVYIFKSGHYATLMGTVDATSNNPVIDFEGANCKAYFPLSNSGFTKSESGGSATNETKIGNGIFDTSGKMTITATSGNTFQVNYAMPKIDKLGEYVGITAITKFGTVTGSFSGLDQFLVSTTAYPAGAVVSNAELSNSIAGLFSGETSSWNFEGVLPYKVMAGTSTGDRTAEVLESGIVVEFKHEDIEPYKIQEQYEETVTGGFAVQTQFEDEEEGFSETIIKTRTKIVNTPSEIEYIYCSGKGRKYHSDIASRTSYSATDFYANPVYIIEDIIRKELDLGDSEIDTTMFDNSGDSPNGHIKDIYDDSIGDIKFAFSQNKFINSKDLINRLCKQILSWVFISGDGKFKIRTLRGTGDYSSADKTIDFNDINLKNISKTPLGGVRNDITINHSKDYGQDQFLSSVNPTADSTSEGNTVAGYKQTLKLKMDADIIDSTTATKLAEAYRDVFKDRKVIINFDCLRAKYNDLEIGDIILFSNWDSSIKIYGDAMGTDYYKIMSISKKPNSSSIKAIKVS